MSEEKKQIVTAYQITETVETFDYYSCEEAVKRLNDYLDQELEPAERGDVMKHLAICKPCLERFSFEESLLVQIKQKMQKLCAPANLRERLGSLIKK